MKEKIAKKLKILLDGVGDMALKRRARFLIEGIDPQDGERILDLGCGDGFYLYLLSNLGVDIKLEGSDLEKANLESARRNLKSKQIKLIQGDLMQKLPFKDNYFEKIVMSEVAEHLPDDIKGLKEARRVLKPGGVILLSVPNANYPFLWDPVNWVLERTTGKHVKTGFWAGLWFNHIRLYTPKRIKGVMEKAGFRIEEIKSTTFWCLPFNHHVVNIVARLLWGGKLSPNFSAALNKYESNAKRPFVISLMFSFVNAIDSLNDLYSPKNSGVGVLVKASK